MQSTSSSDASYEPENRLVGDDRPRPRALRHHAVRRCLPDDCLALLAPEPHRRRVDHLAATGRCIDRRTKLRGPYGRCIGEFWLQEQAGGTGEGPPEGE